MDLIPTFFCGISPIRPDVAEFAALHTIRDSHRAPSLRAVQLASVIGGPARPFAPFLLNGYPLSYHSCAGLSSAQVANFPKDPAYQLSLNHFTARFSDRAG